MLACTEMFPNKVQRRVPGRQQFLKNRDWMRKSARPPAQQPARNWIVLRQLGNKQGFLHEVLWTCKIVHHLGNAIQAPNKKIIEKRFFKDIRIFLKLDFNVFWRCLRVLTPNTIKETLETKYFYIFLSKNNIFPSTNIKSRYILMNFD